MRGSAALPVGILLGMAVLVSGSAVLGVEQPAEHFVHQWRFECHLTNGTQRIHFLYRVFWGRREFINYDSDRGRYVAVTELGKPDVERWNKDPAALRSQKANADVVCPHNFEITEPIARARRVQPKVQITPTEYDSTTHNALLICTVGSFYPSEIEVKWFRNGKEETKVWTTDLTRNGDWTFQIEVMLETQPARGDVYACQVEHASFEGPVTVQWEPESDSARSKRWTGIVGIVLGLVFVAPGLFLYLKNKKGMTMPQTPGLMS